MKKKATKKKSKLMLYVWTGFCTDYTSGLAFAIAPSEKNARKQVSKEHGYELGESYWGTLSVHPIKKIAFTVAGGG